MPISMHGLINYAAALAVPAVLAGCATHYVEPASGPTATVTHVAGPGVRQALVHNVPGGSCANLTLISVIGPKPTAVAFSDKLQVVPERTIKVRADMPVTAQFRDSRTEYPLERSCSITAQFVPQPNASYKMIWGFGKTSCDVQVLVKSESSGEWKQEASTKALRQYCMN